MRTWERWVLWTGLGNITFVVKAKCAPDRYVRADYGEKRLQVRLAIQTEPIITRWAWATDPRLFKARKQAERAGAVAALGGPDPSF